MMPRSGQKSWIFWHYAIAVVFTNVGTLRVVRWFPLITTIKANILALRRLIHPFGVRYCTAQTGIIENDAKASTRELVREGAGWWSTRVLVRALCARRSVPTYPCFCLTLVKRTAFACIAALRLWPMLSLYGTAVAFTIIRQFEDHNTLHGKVKNGLKEPIPLWTPHHTSAPVWKQEHCQNSSTGQIAAFACRKSWNNQTMCSVVELASSW